MTTQYFYPELGDPLPRPKQQVALITHDNKHRIGVWAHDCKAWARLHALERKPNPQTTLPLEPKE